MVQIPASLIVVSVVTLAFIIAMLVVRKGRRVSAQEHRSNASPQNTADAALRSPSKQKVEQGTVASILKKLVPQRKLTLRNITEEQKAKLSDAGIEIEDIEIQGDSAISFPSSARWEVLQALNCYQVDTVSWPKADDELIVRPFDGEPRGLARFTVRFENQLGAEIELVTKLIREILLPVVKRKIVVHQGNEIFEPITDEAFHVIVGAAATATKLVRLPARMLKLPTSNLTARQPSGMGLTLRDSESEIAYGELVGNCLYLHIGLSLRRDIALFMRLLEKVTSQAQLDVAARAQDIARSLYEQAEAPPADDYEVASDGFTGAQQTVVNSLVKEILCPALQCDIQIKNQANRNRRPKRKDKRFYIWCHSAPAGDKVIKSPKVIFGHAALSVDVPLPSGLGVPLTDDNGFVIGEIIDNNLFIYVPLVNYGSDEEAWLFAKFLLQVKDQFLSSFGPNAKELMDKGFLADCLLCIEKATANVSEGKKVIRANAKLAADDFAARLSTVKSAEQNYYRLRRSPSSELGKEFDRIMSLSKVLNIRVSKNWMVITTVKLYCYNRETGRYHEIGAFKIHIRTEVDENEENQVLWFNQTRKVDARIDSDANHPHVFSGGGACLGTMEEIFPLLIRKRDFYAAVLAAIKFIEHANTEHDLENWPEAPNYHPA